MARVGDRTEKKTAHLKHCQKPFCEVPSSMPPRCYGLIEPRGVGIDELSLREGGGMDVPSAGVKGLLGSTQGCPEFESFPSCGASPAVGIWSSGCVAALPKVLP